MTAGLGEGPELGRILSALFNRVVENPRLNDRAHLLGIARSLVSRIGLPNNAGSDMAAKVSSPRSPTRKRTGWRWPHVAAHRAASRTAVSCSDVNCASPSNIRGLHREARSGWMGTRVCARRCAGVLTTS